MLTGLVVICAAALLTALGTLFVLRNAVRLGLVAAPNARSSHIRPTPTGGGIGIVAGGTLAGAAAAIALGGWAGWAIVGAGLGIAAIGLLDDLRQVNWLLRLGAQFAAASVVVLAAPPAPALLAVAAILAGVAWINIFNFMDGIDGLAGSEGAFIFGAAALLAATGQTDPVNSASVWWLTTLAVVCVVFVGFNWPPARVFMGDVASTWLGLTIGALALVTIAEGALSLWQWFILVALFASDGGMTLARRLVQRERVFEAHRRHAYQKLARKFGRHMPVTAGAVAINLLWLLPLSWVAGRLPEHGLLIAVLAYLPLLALMVATRAGAPEPGEI